MGFIYAVGFARWNEDQDLKARFGSEWLEYKKNVKNWMPSLEPCTDPNQKAVLYYAKGCGICSDLASKVEKLHPKGLQLKPAQEHPSCDLNRVTYELTGPNIFLREQGVLAVARALEHTNIMWTIFACFMRLPVMSWVLQAIIDSVGGAPKTIRRVVS